MPFRQSSADNAGRALPDKAGRPAGISVVKRWGRQSNVHSPFGLQRLALNAPKQTFLGQAVQKIHAAAFSFYFLS